MKGAKRTDERIYSVSGKSFSVINNSKYDWEYFSLGYCLRPVVFTSQIGK